MTDAEFEKFIAEAIEALRRKNAALEEQHGLGSYARWDHDGELGTLTFSNTGGQAALEATTTMIGSYSLNTKTWLWAWGNESQADEERAKASKLKKLFEMTGMEVFGDAHVDCDEYLAWELAAASVHHLGSLGCYRAPIGHLWVFLSIDTIASVPYSA